MKSYKIFGSIMIMLAISTNTLFAQKMKPSTPEKVTSVEGITEYKLGNGLIVLLFSDPSKATITVNITYQVGSCMESQGEYGMAHLLEHMVFKGSTHHTNIPQELSSHGADYNAETSYDRTNYYETFNSSDENLNWALDMEADRMVNSFIADTALAHEFTVVRNEFEARENYPSSVLEERVMSAAYLWHNYGRSTIGSKVDIEKVSASRLKVFYQKYYQPDNAVLTIAGKIDEEKTLALINKYFGVIQKPTRTILQPYTVEPAQDGEKEVTLKRVGDLQLVSAGYHICSGSHPDIASLHVLMEILSDQPSGRIYKALVETKKASSIGGEIDELKDPGYAYFAAAVLKEKPLSDARNAMMNVLDSLPYQPISQEELDRAKNKIMTGIDLAYNSSERIGLVLSEFIALGDWRLFFINRDRIEKTTVDDVNRVAKTYFKPSNRVVGLFIPDSKPDRVEVSAAPNVDSIVKNYKGKKALANAETFEPTPENIDARTKTGKIEGGAKYALLSKTTRGNKVNVIVTLRIGSAKTLENKRALFVLTANMLNKGTKTKTWQQIKDAFDKLSTQVEINSDEQKVNIQLTTTRENFDNALKLLTEVIRGPVFPANEFDILKDAYMAELEQEHSDPKWLAVNLAVRKINQYAKSDFRYVGTYDEQAAEYMKTKLEDLRALYNNFYNSDSATVAIVGDFDEATALNELKVMLTNWHSSQTYTRAPEIYFEVQPSDEKAVTPDKSNAMIIICENLKLCETDIAYPALTIGNYIFGGESMNSRLATRIRQKEGISYSVASSINADSRDQSGSFFTYAIYNPNNAERLVAAYKDEIAKMLKDGFTDAELKDAKSGYLGENKLARADDQQVAMRLNLNLDLGRTMKWSAEFDKKIENISLSEVNTAMRKYIHPEKMTYVQAGDFKTK